MDTPGIVCREAQLFHQVSARLFGPPSRKSLGTGTTVTVTSATRKIYQQTPPGDRPRYNRWRSLLCGIPPWKVFDKFRPPAAPPPLTYPQSPATSEQQPVAGEFKPKNLLYPVDYWEQWFGKPVTDTLEEAVLQLEQYLGVQRTPINLEERWLEGNPAKTQESLKTYLQDVRDPGTNPLPAD